MDFKLDTNEIKNTFRQCQSKEESFRALVKISKTLVRLDTNLKSNSNAVTGCESQVWLTAEKDEETGLWRFQADSDAKLIRGFLAILLAYVEELNSEQIQQLDLLSQLNDLNLEAYLTSSRNNGILAIITRIKELTQ